MSKTFLAAPVPPECQSLSCRIGIIVYVAQDEAGFSLLQKNFNMYIKAGYGTSYLSKNGTCMYILMCSKCMRSFKELFNKIAKSTTLDDIPVEYMRH